VRTDTGPRHPSKVVVAPQIRLVKAPLSRYSAVRGDGVESVEGDEGVVELAAECVRPDERRLGRQRRGDEGLEGSPAVETVT
jgi:hypothetical protein